MKLKLSLIFIIIITLLILTSCIVTSRAIGVEISCDEFNENPRGMINDFELETGDKITVKLCSNASTGFQWEYRITSENVIKEEDHDFEEPKDDMPGAPGVEVWTFEAVAKGTTEVQMEYSQPCEGGLKAEWTYTMKIKVE